MKYHQQHTHSNKGVSVANSIHHSNKIYNYFKTLKLGQFLSDVYLNHLMTIIVSVFLRGYRGKTIDFAQVSHHHRTTIAYFLNHGKWNDLALQDTLKSSVIQIIYQEAQRSGQPILCIVDDTIASHAKPSSQALHPIEAAYFHQSHLKGCQDYGHQVVSVMLSCNGIILNYTVILYDKSRSKIQIVQEIAKELPIAPVISYFLCDSWYTSAKVMDSFIQKGFYTIGALKTNRIIYPCGIRQKASEFALHLRRSDPKALRIFLSTNVGMSTQEILDTYTKRWPIELFFRQSKSKLALDKYQIRSKQGIQRYWLIMSLVHYLCCTCMGNYCTFEEGYSHLQKQLKVEQLGNLHQFIKNGATLEDVLELVG